MILNKLRFAPALLVAGLFAAGVVFAGTSDGPASDDPPPKANAKAKTDDKPAKTVKKAYKKK